MQWGGVEGPQAPAVAEAAGRGELQRPLTPRTSQEVMRGGRAGVWTRPPCPRTLWPDFSRSGWFTPLFRRVDESDHYWQRESGPRSRPLGRRRHPRRPLQAWIAPPGPLPPATLACGARAPPSRGAEPRAASPGMPQGCPSAMWKLSPARGTPSPARSCTHGVGPGPRRGLRNRFRGFMFPRSTPPFPVI